MFFFLLELLLQEQKNVLYQEDRADFSACRHGRDARVVGVHLLHRGQGLVPDGIVNSRKVVIVHLCHLREGQQKTHDVGFARAERSDELFFFFFLH